MQSDGMSPSAITQPMASSRMVGYTEHDLTPISELEDEGTPVSRLHSADKHLLLTLTIRVMYHESLPKASKSDHKRVDLRKVHALRCTFRAYKTAAKPCSGVLKHLQGRFQVLQPERKHPQGPWLGI